MSKHNIKDNRDYNIEDYLIMRSDVPFGTDPFNEVDNVVLSELSYVEMGEKAGGEGFVSLSEIRDDYFEKHPREEVRKTEGINSQAPFLMDYMLSGVRFSDVRVGRYMNVIDAVSDMQFAAMTFMLGDGSAFVCFRGTDSSLVGWKESLKLSFKRDSEGQVAALKYLEEAAELTDGPLRVGGHSKGGNFAVYAASFCGESVQDRLLEVFVNDGPGFPRDITDADGYRRIIPKIKSIVPDTSIVGQLLIHEYPDIVIRSSEQGFKQHDVYTWCLERNQFTRSSLSNIGRLLRRTQKNWLVRMDEEARESLVNTFFDVLEAADVDSFEKHEIQNRKTLEHIVSSLRQLPKNQQQELWRMGEALIKSGGDAAKEHLKDLFKAQ